MPLETGTSIADLDQSWPLGGDRLNKGDDHIRLVKSILKIQFPGALGDGFDKPIVATEDELNYLSGVTSSVQGQLDGHEARISQNEADIAALQSTITGPAGLRLSMHNPLVAVPLGWTADPSVSNHMLRAVDGTTLLGGEVGGTDDPTLNDKVPTHNHTGVTTGNGLHSHQYKNSTVGGSGGNIGGNNQNTVATSSDGLHTHSLTIDNNVGGSNWTPRFASMIIIERDAPV